MEEAINKLKILEQRVVKLFFFGELNQTEIAKKLGISTNYTSYLLHRSIDKLKNDLSDKDETSVPIASKTKAASISVYDKYSGLYSENYIRLRIKEEIERHQRSPRVFSLVIIIADNIPEDNAEKNIALKSITTYLTRSIRTYDLLTYIGEGQFMLLMPQPKREAAIFSERIARGLNEQKQEMPVTINIGIAAFPNDAVTSDELISLAINRVTNKNQ